MPPVPPKRHAWGVARAAELAWSRALLAHQSAAPNSDGLRERLLASSAALAGLAASARQAQKAGFVWVPLAPGGADDDVLPGELAPQNRWLAHAWVSVEEAERHAAAMARADSLEDFADALDRWGQALGELAEVVDEPRRPIPKYFAS